MALQGVEDTPGQGREGVLAVGKGRKREGNPVQAGTRESSEYTPALVRTEVWGEGGEGGYPVLVGGEGGYPCPGKDRGWGRSTGGRDPDLI